MKKMLVSGGRSKLLVEGVTGLHLRETAENFWRKRLPTAQILAKNIPQTGQAGWKAVRSGGDCVKRVKVKNH
ncbi:MAG TPA: hypothetical protein VIK35_11375 [Verrucomicrobiae bacterium]